MKKIILSLVTILAFGVSNAQETKEVEKTCTVKLGVKAGVNYDWLDTGAIPVYDLRPEVGYHAGLLAEFKLCDKFSLQPEALYSFHSFNFNGNDNPDNKVEMSEITLPIVGKFYFTKALSLEVGPQVSFVMTAKNEGEDIKDDVREFNVASVSGLAYTLDMGVFIQVRYVYNFLDFFNAPRENSMYGIQTSVGYQF